MAPKTYPKKAPAKTAKPAARKDRYSAKSTSAPAAMAKVVQRSSLTSTMMSDSERIFQFPGSIAFNVASRAINPGLADLLPQMSGHAALYDSYRFKKLMFHYRTTKGTSSNGNVMMSWDADAVDLLPTSAMDMSNQAKAVDGPVWKGTTLMVPCDNQWRFTRTSAVPGTDGKTYDMGRFLFAAEGTDASVQGYIECSYTIEFKHKTPNALSGISTNRQIFQAVNAALTVAAAPANFGAVPVNPLGITVGDGLVTTAANTGSLVLPGGRSYNISVHGGGSLSFTTLDLRVNPNGAGWISLRQSGFGCPYVSFVYTAPSGNVAFALVPGSTNSGGGTSGVQYAITQALLQIELL